MCEGGREMVLNKGCGSQQQAILNDLQSHVGQFDGGAAFCCDAVLAAPQGPEGGVLVCIPHHPFCFWFSRAAKHPSTQMYGSLFCSNI